MRHARVAPSVQEAHEILRLTKTIKIPIRRVEMKFFTKSGGRTDISESNFINGIIPRKIIIGLVNSEALNGHLNKNPFNFQNFGVKSVVLRKNGIPVSTQEIELDYNNQDYQEGYLSLLMGNNYLHTDRSLFITPENYSNGNCFYAFDLTPDFSKGLNLNLVEEGKLSIEIKLEKPLLESITIVGYLVYDGMIEIDNSGSVSYE
jgi:hypothetical protein